MKVKLTRRITAPLFGGRLKVRFSGKLKTILRGEPSNEPPLDDECFRLLEDGFVRLTEGGDFRVLQLCGGSGSGSTLDATLDFTFE